MHVTGAVAAVLLVLLLPAGAAAAPTWLPASTISAAGGENTPADLAVAPDGTAIIVWQRAECEGSAESHSCKNGRVRFSIRPPGGSFSPAAEIPGQGPFASNNARPRVAADAAGNAIAAWVGTTPAGPRVKYAFRPAGGTFGNAKDLSDPAAISHSFPSIDMAPAGRAVLTFSRHFAGEVNRFGYALRPPGGDFSGPDSLVGDTGTLLNAAPTVHLDAAGNALATWARSTPAEGVLIQYATLGAQAVEFSPATSVEKGNPGGVAMAPSGAAVMVWNKSGSAQDIRYAFRPPGGPFGPPATLIEPDQRGVLRVAMANDGSATLAWNYLVEGKSYTRWAAAPPGGPFGPALPIQPDNRGFPQGIDVSDQGTVALLWTSTAGPALEMQASLRPPGGLFGPPAPLPGPLQGADRFGGAVGFDAEGNAAAIWNGFDSEPPEDHDVPLLAAGLDAAGPRILALDAPATARDDTAVGLGMAAFDVWSPVVATAFDFGDGSRAPGPTAAHRFLAGNRMVTASATDAVGNSTVTTAQVEVADVTRPSIRRLRVTPRRFFSLRGPVAHAARRYGARIRFILSERARVRLDVQEKRRGVRVRVRGKRRCLPRTPRNVRRGKGRCTRFKRVRRLVRRNGRPNANSVRLSGRFRGRKLRPGGHRVVAVAIDPTGNRSRLARAGFRVRPRR